LDSKNIKSRGETGLNIASNFPDEAKRLRLILGITIILLGVGLVAPIITLNKFVLIENTFSVLGGVIELFREGHVFLFIVITGFSIVLPLLKIAVLVRLLGGKENKVVNLDKYLHWMHLYGKWSMLDVFVVAVLVVSVKLGAIASVEMRYGLYAFAAAVVLSMYVTARVVSLTDRSGDNAPKDREP
jgi:paraquat-inducible protein A